MSDITRRTGGCLCGQVRYEAQGEPDFAGYCFCADCRKASGSGFVPFMGFPASALRITGETRLSRTKALRGEAVRNHCAVCGGLVFGGIVGPSLLPHRLCRLARRPVVIPSEDSDLRARPPRMGPVASGSYRLRDVAGLIMTEEVRAGRPHSFSQGFAVNPSRMG